MPSGLETMKMQEEPDQSEELEKDEEAWPRLPGGEEVSELACNASPH